MPETEDKVIPFFPAIRYFFWVYLLYF